MDHITDVLGLLDRPAFCVQNGIITAVNAAAAGRMIETGTPISDILQTGQEEYQAFSDGCLYLSLSVAEQTLGASVTKMPDCDIFRIEQDEDNRELQAMALAAQELRGPLSTVMVTADRLFPMCDAQSDENAARLNRGLLQMLRVIGNMSDAIRYSTASADHQTLQDLTGVIGEVFRKAAVLSQQAGIPLEYEDYPESVWSLADAEKLERAILNIISNAQKFAADGTIRAKLSRRGNKLYLTVQNSAAGNQPARVDFFSRYTREAAIEDGRFGIGLGMVLIRSAAALHGGTVLIDQPESSGLRVTMSLAIRQGEAQLRSPARKIDYSGGHDQALVELAETLPASLYTPK